MEGIVSYTIHKLNHSLELTRKFGGIIKDKMGKGGIAIKTRRNSMSDADIKALQEYTVKKGPQGVPLVKGDVDSLPQKAQEFIAHHVALCQPQAVYICDGSQDEAEELTDKLVKRGMLEKLDKMDNCIQMKKEEHR